MDIQMMFAGAVVLLGGGLGVLATVGLRRIAARLGIRREGS